ncbi:hypothetical protein MP638_003982 [Amoeboaphelidium occidentale]|nr:hypothetical protein MP638_003982 [Amoeboaphelidium occidentale]
MPMHSIFKFIPPEPVKRGKKKLSDSDIEVSSSDEEERRIRNSRGLKNRSRSLNAQENHYETSYKNKVYWAKTDFSENEEGMYDSTDGMVIDGGADKKTIRTKNILQRLTYPHEECYKAFHQYNVGDDCDENDVNGHVEEKFYYEQACYGFRDGDRQYVYGEPNIILDYIPPLGPDRPYPKKRSYRPRKPRTKDELDNQMDKYRSRLPHEFSASEDEMQQDEQEKLGYRIREEGVPNWRTVPQKSQEELDMEMDDYNAKRQVKA